MLRAAAPPFHRRLSLSLRALWPQQQAMATKTKAEDHPNNYVFGDALQRDANLPHSKSPALEFQVRATAGRARAAQMQLPHFLCETPMFMPVGTQGTVKGLTPDMLERCKCHLILGNTYHLGNRPGADAVEQLGGLHKFSGWDRAMLTDSGGFQMVSLLHLAQITEEGVTFCSPADGSSMLLTPEHSIAIQNRLGADILMALDDVVSSVADSPRRFAEATDRTTRWIDRCIAAHSRPQDQSLFAIVQGGLDAALRTKSLADLTARNLPGYAIGGLAGGEDKESFWKVVAQCAPELPAGKPRYVMGIGYPVDIVVCVALGADMFDSVFPTRTARFGVALVDTHGGFIKLKQAQFRDDEQPIDAACPCATCRKYSRAALHNALCHGTPAGASLVSVHNVAYTQNLTRSIREAIAGGTFPAFVQSFMCTQYGAAGCPEWVRNALTHVGIDVP
eukprot:jgi/Ulvmu1/6587/UM003_0224.1